MSVIHEILLNVTSDDVDGRSFWQISSNSLLQLALLTLNPTVNPYSGEDARMRSMLQCDFPQPGAKTPNPINKISVRKTLSRRTRTRG